MAWPRLQPFIFSKSYIGFNFRALNFLSPIRRFGMKTVMKQIQMLKSPTI